jgi:hypothetical protein
MYVADWDECEEAFDSGDEYCDICVFTRKIYTMA